MDEDYPNLFLKPVSQFQTFGGPPCLVTLQLDSFIESVVNKVFRPKKKVPTTADLAKAIAEEIRALIKKICKKKRPVRLQILYHNDQQRLMQLPGQPPNVFTHRPVVQASIALLRKRKVRVHTLYLSGCRSQDHLELIREAFRSKHMVHVVAVKQCVGLIDGAMEAYDPSDASPIDSAVFVWGRGTGKQLVGCPWILRATEYLDLYTNTVLPKDCAKLYELKAKRRKKKLVGKYSTKSKAKAEVQRRRLDLKLFNNFFDAAALASAQAALKKFKCNPQCPKKKMVNLSVLKRRFVLQQRSGTWSAFGQYKWLAKFRCHK